MKVFVTTMVYALGKQLGMRMALEELGRQLTEPSRDSLPVVRTIARIKDRAFVVLYSDIGATCLGKARSRAFHEAAKACKSGDAPELGCEAWISLDDDIEVTKDVVLAMLEALADPSPRVVVVPYMLRAPDNAETMLAVRLPTVRVERRLYETGARLVSLGPSRGGGFGMVGVNRAALADIAAAAAAADDLWFVDADNQQKLAVFHDILEDRVWLGEDLAFFRRIPAHVSIEALLDGDVVHAGIRTNLATL